MALDQTPPLTMAQHFSVHDWAPALLGPQPLWPVSLQTLVRLILVSTAPMLITWGPQRIMLYNDAYSALLGARHPAALGRPYDVVWPETWDNIAPLYARAMLGLGLIETNTAFTIELDNLGKLPHFAISLAPITEPGGQVDGLLWTLIDITAQHRAEQAIAAEALRAHQAESLLRGVSEAIPGFVWGAATDGALDYSTQRWVEFSGGRPGQSLGGGWADFVHADDLQAAHVAWRHALATGTPYDTRFRVRRYDGVYRWFLVRAMPLRDDTGAILRWAGINVDVNEQIEAELALTELNATLEARVAQATAERELVEEALRQSQKMEAIGQLTGGIAHDFNNMLQGVIGSLDLTRRRVAQGRVGEIDRLLDLAMQGVDRAAGLTAQLLSFARRQTLSPRVADPAGTVQGMAELVRRTVGPGVVVAVRVPDDAVQVLCDVNGLESAVLNLAINARDAMPTGGTLTLAVRTATLTAAEVAGHDGVTPGPFIQIDVSDTGTGMAAEVAAHAFEPFFTTKPMGQGTGLGLSQIYGFMRQSGGFVTLRTALGAGTTVSLLLPSLAAAVPDRASTAMALPTSPG